MKIASKIEDCGRALLDLDPDPVPRFLILRYILNQSDRESAVAQAREQMLKSKWVSDLANEQLKHGGWARFHTADSRSGGKVGNTEQGVQRAVELGLDITQGILAQARNYLLGLLAGQLPFPDHEERNDRWAVGEEMFVASTLAWIDPGNPALEKVYDKWRQIAEQTFASGHYDPEAEWQAHCQITGATTMRCSYLVLRNRYAVFLLSKVQHLLTDRTESSLVDWLWTQPRGLGYVDVPMSRPFTELSDREISRWFFSHKVMSGFRSWPRKMKQIEEDLWEIRNQDGLWNFGRVQRAEGLRLSESWRKVSSRVIDHSVAVILLLAAGHRS